MADMSQAEIRSHNALMMRAIVERVAAVLETFFGGYMMVESADLNTVYLILLKDAAKFAEFYPRLKDPLDEVVALFPNLYEATADTEFPDENWEFGGQQAVQRLKGRASEIHVQEMSSTAEPSADEKRFLTLVDESIKRHSEEKARIWKRMEARVQEVAQANTSSSTPTTESASRSAAATVAPITPKPLHDRAHAACVEELVSKLRTDGFNAQPEGTYSRYGERGSVDVFFLSDDDPSFCAIYEMWTEIDNLNEALRKLDEKSRIFATAYCEQAGMKRPTLTRAHFVLLATKPNMDLIGAHKETFTAKFAGQMTGGRRFVLQVFDPLSGDLHDLSPTPNNTGLGKESLRKWARFANKAVFYKAWRSRKQEKE